MAQTKQNVTTRPQPTKRETAAIDKAREAIIKRPKRPSIEWENGRISITHSDDKGAHVQRMNDAFGTCSSNVDAVFLGMLDHVTCPRGENRGDSDAPLNTGLAIVSAIEPQNELEAALAIQMTGTHFLAIEMLGRARGTERSDHIELYGNMAVKLQRTFAAQIEALAKLRGGGKQTVEVKHTYVDARNSQNVIAESVTTGGGSQKNGNQPHEAETIASLAVAPGMPMWGAQQAGQSMPGTSHEGQEAMPAARRQKPRST